MPPYEHAAQGWCFITVKDARLKGYSPLRVTIPEGWTARLASAQPMKLGLGKSAQSALAVRVEAVSPAGEVWTYPLRAVMKAGVPKLWTLELMTRYVDRLIAPKAPDQFLEDLGSFYDGPLEEGEVAETIPFVRAKGGPWLDANAAHAVVEAAQDWRYFSAWSRDQHAKAVPVSISAAHLCGLLEAAYLAGRATQGAEAPSDAARTQTLDAALAKSAATLSRDRKLAAWARDVLIPNYKGTKKLSFQKLGALMQERWSEGPCKGDQELEASYLAREIIPKMVAAGLLKLPV